MFVIEDLSSVLENNISRYEKFDKTYNSISEAMGYSYLQIKMNTASHSALTKHKRYDYFQNKTE